MCGGTVKLFPHIVVIRPCLFHLLLLLQVVSAMRPSVVVDLYPILVRRADAHTRKWIPEKRIHDCLHFCVPGPQDIVGNVLQRVLQFV